MSNGSSLHERKEELDVPLVFRQERKRKVNGAKAVVPRSPHNQQIKRKGKEAQTGKGKKGEGNSVKGTLSLKRSTLLLLLRQRKRGQHCRNSYHMDERGSK